MTKLKKKEEKLREEEARSSAQRIAHSQVQAECESLRETRQKLEDRVEALKERMGEVIHKAAELRKDNEDLKDSISKSDELIANLKIELSRAKQRAHVFEQRASEGEARDRGGLKEQVGILSRKLEKEAEDRAQSKCR
jgi:chromosome segregation ATPase